MRDLDIEKLSINIQKWISEYLKNANAQKLVLGLSGGIDSAVTAALCARALGEKKIYGLIMPCQSLSSDIKDAMMIAEDLCINYEIIDLNPVYKLFLKTVALKSDSNKIAESNLKPRLRMVTLYYFSQSIGNCFVVGTGNRAEIALGYFTKYGDGGVDFEPLGNLYKSEVRALAKVVRIPAKIIKKPPSAGLWPGQTDEGEIGLSYDIIDEILYRIDNGLDFDGLKAKNVEKVRKLMRKAEHKLKMPPAYEVSQ
jgi:NAD+ synthase